jgi:FxsC-like protein
MSDYWFFLSYARRNDVSYTLGPKSEQKSRVAKFRDELAAEIISRAKTGVTDIEQVGFLDQSGIEPGDKWDDKVAEALRTARVMVCLFSRAYFDSKVCGQEFEVFRARVADYAKGAAQPPLIIPVLWHRPDKIKPTPDVTADLQYTYDEYPPDYAAEGLEYLMRANGNDGEYQKFLIRMADRVVDVATRYAMQAAAVCPPLKSVQNAFASKSSAVTAVAAVGAANGGPGIVRFVFVAGNRAELETIRKKIDAYANEARFWKPYTPQTETAVGLLTQAAASSVLLQQELLPVTNTLMDELAAADDNNIIVVLIVDPWSLHLQLYEHQMRQYDQRNFISSALLVVWNESEQEPGLPVEKVWARVVATFRNNLATNTTYFRRRVSSEDELRAEINAAIVEIRRRLEERGKLFHPVDEGGFEVIPQVTATSGETR